MSALEWGTVSEADLPQLASLARACLRHDGGLPQLAGEPMLRRLFVTDVSIGGRDDTGELVAVAALSWDAVGRRIASGLVHPSTRRQGHGEALVEWAREHADGQSLRVVAESMSLEAEELFARSGLRRTFAETVMRHKLRHIPTIPRPDGVRTLAFGDETAPMFYEAYRHAFAERPGFADPGYEEWLEDIRSEEGFRSGDSRVALGPGEDPAGFVLLVDNWIEAVGAVPRWRGQRLGAHLVVRSLTVFRRTDEHDAWLCVSTDNPARSLYERLGFRSKGTRARYEQR